MVTHEILLSRRYAGKRASRNRVRMITASQVEFPGTGVGPDACFTYVDSKGKTVDIYLDLTILKTHTATTEQALAADVVRKRASGARREPSVKDRGGSGDGGGGGGGDGGNNNAPTSKRVDKLE